MNIDAQPSFYADMHGLANLKSDAAAAPEDEATLRKVAAQFESMFTQMLLKAQREASMGDPIFDSSSMDFYREMHDKQLSVQMSESGGFGIADMLVAQLSKKSGQPSTTGQGLGIESYTQSPIQGAKPIPKAATVPAEDWHDRESFIEAMLPHAKRGAEALGVDPRLIIAQSALETGWGEHVPADARGSSFNLFGIKAQKDWSGERIWKDTLEFSAGQFDSHREPFRRYQSMGESVDDYVQFLQQNPRYENTLKAAADGAQAFVNELSAAGYASDPNYAQKILRVMDSDGLRGLDQ